MRGIVWVILLGAVAWLGWTEGVPRLRTALAREQHRGYLERPPEAELGRASEAGLASSLAAGQSSSSVTPLSSQDPVEALETGQSGPEEAVDLPRPTPTLTDPPPSPAEVLGASEDGGDDYRVELERADLGELGRLLAHEDRFQVLEEYLNEGDGSSLPVATRRLASAFWLALGGHPEDAEQLAWEFEDDPDVTPEQLDLLRTAVRGDAPRVREASFRAREPLAWGMRMAQLDRMASSAARRGKAAEAARSNSELLLLGIDAPWEPDRDDLRRWAAALNEVQENHRWNPAGSWPSLDYQVRAGQSLVLIRKDVLANHPGTLLCVGQIRRANRLGERPIQPGDSLRIPTEVAHVLVDLDAHMLLLMMGEEVVGAWEVGIGRAGEETPTGTFEVGLKQENPSYMPVGKPNLPFGHPGNPLGTRWIAWHRHGENTGYGFHGTNDPEGVGGEVSNGCIRMLNKDVEALFELLPLGAKVLVQP